MAIEASTSRFKIFSVLEPSHLMALQGIPLIVMGPIPNIEISREGYFPFLGALTIFFGAILFCCIDTRSIHMLQAN